MLSLMSLSVSSLSLDPLLLESVSSEEDDDQNFCIWQFAEGSKGRVDKLNVSNWCMHKQISRQTSLALTRWAWPASGLMLCGFSLWCILFPTGFSEISMMFTQKPDVVWPKNGNKQQHALSLFHTLYATTYATQDDFQLYATTYATQDDFQLPQSWSQSRAEDRNDLTKDWGNHNLSYCLWKKSCTSWLESDSFTGNWEKAYFLKPKMQTKPRSSVS